MSTGSDRITAQFYDGVSSKPHLAEITLSPVGIRLNGTPFDPARISRIVEPIGPATWLFELKDGGLLEADLAAGATLAQALGHRQTRIRRWEKSLLLIVAAIPLLLLAVYGTGVYAVPFLADRVALALPRSADTIVGRQSLALFEKFTAPSRISAARQNAVRRRFDAMAAAILGGDVPARLEFRDAPEIGPNAFALPGGTVMVTDQLMALLNDDEVLAVLAHELGHVKNRHVMRMVLRSSGLAVLAAGVVGDASTLSGIMAGLPVLVTQLDFSREFETQADNVAFQWLTRPGGHPCDFATALLKIQTAMRVEAPGHVADTPPDWL